MRECGDQDAVRWVEYCMYCVVEILRESGSVCMLMDVENECRTTRFRRSEYECWRANRPGDADTIDALMRQENVLRRR